MNNDAAVGIVVAVENKRAKLVGREAGRRRYEGDDRFEKLVNAGAKLRRNLHGNGRIEAEIVIDLLERTRYVGGGKVYFIDDGNDLEIMLEGEIHVRQGLTLDALRGVD